VKKVTSRDVIYKVKSSLNDFFLKISSFIFVNSENVITFVHSSKFMSYGMKNCLSQAVKPRMTLSA